jgi:NifB/MoaA-like Fe-S oxidoreductase
VLAQIERWQARYVEALGRRLVFAADEYYLMGDRAFPDADAYEDFPQHENGIGMARTFTAEVARAMDGHHAPGTQHRTGFFAWVDGAPASGYRALRVQSAEAAHEQPAEPSNDQAVAPVGIVTGEYGARVLSPMLEDLSTVATAPVRLITIPNSFFGGNIAVTGLLTGRDVANALGTEPREHRYLIPDVVLSDGRFLDGTTIDDLPLSVEVVPTDGVSLVGALAPAR